MLRLQRGCFLVPGGVDVVCCVCWVVVACCHGEGDVYVSFVSDVYCAVLCAVRGDLAPVYGGAVDCAGLVCVGVYAYGLDGSCAVDVLLG